MKDQRLTDVFPTKSVAPNTTRKGTAVPAGPRNSGGKSYLEANAKLRHLQWLSSSRLAQLSFVSVANDDGHFCGWRQSYDLK